MSEKILFIQPSYYPANPSSGPNLSLHLLTKALARRGIDVTVYTTDYDVKLQSDVCHDVDGVKVFYFKTHGRTYVEQITLKMYRTLKENASDFDWVYITPIWSPMLWYPMKFISQIGVPFIVSPRGGLYPEVVKKRNFIIKKLAFTIIVRRYIEKAGFIHYTTEDEREKVENYWKIKVPALVVPNGIDLKKYESLPPKGFFKDKFGIRGRYILHLGRIGWIKGLDTTAEAFKMLLREHPDLEWVIAGRDDGYKKSLLKLIKALGCEDKVRFVGLLQGEDKLGALVDSDVFVLPSYSENFAMAAVEAMASGTPTLISDKVGIHREVQRFGAGIVVERKVGQVYEGIKVIIENKDLKEKISRNGRKLVREYFDIEKVADNFIKIISR